MMVNFLVIILFYATELLSANNQSILVDALSELTQSLQTLAESFSPQPLYDIHNLQDAVHDYATSSRETLESVPTKLNDSSAPYLAILDKFSTDNEVKLLQKTQLAVNELQAAATKKLTLKQKKEIQQELIPLVRDANQNNVQTLTDIELSLRLLKNNAEQTAKAYPIKNPFNYKENPYALLGINRLPVTSIDAIDIALSKATRNAAPESTQYQKLLEARNYIATIFELDQQAKQADQNLARAQQDIKKYKESINALNEALAQIKAP